MSDQFLGEIRPFGFNFAPVGWMLCNGQTLPISQYAALFSLLGITYGGNGTNNFQLPNFQGRAPVHAGTGAGLSTIPLGQAAGTETVTVLITQMPSHSHAVNALAHTATTNVPAAGQKLAEGHGQGRGAYAINTYAGTGNATTLAPAVIGATGGGQPHNNLQPYLTINWCIAIQGIFPPRS